MATLEQLMELQNLNECAWECTRQSRWKETTQRYLADMLQKNIELREGEGIQVKRVGIETKAYVAKTGNGDDEGEGGDNQQPGGGIDIEG